MNDRTSSLGACSDSTIRLTSAITKSGHWWEPGAQDNARPGVLQIQEDGRASLELIGGFDLRIIEPLDSGYAVAAGSRNLDTLFGDCEGEPITLFRSLELESRGSFFSGQPSFQRLHAHRVIVGAHVETEHSPTFTSAALEIENLTTFLGIPTVTYDYRKNTVAFAELRLDTVEVDGWMISADRATKGFNHAKARGGMHINGEARAVIRATPPQPASLEDFDALVLELTDLVTLAAGDAVHPPRSRPPTTLTTNHPLRQPSATQNPRNKTQGDSRRLHHWLGPRRHHSPPHQ